MIVKVFEVRDRGTFIPVVAIQLGPDSEAEQYLFARAGYGQHAEDQSEYVILIAIESPIRAEYSPFDWEMASRTMRIAHDYIQRHFGLLDSGEVIDVQFILNETPGPKLSERITEG